MDLGTLIAACGGEITTLLIYFSPSYLFLNYVHYSLHIVMCAFCVASLGLRCILLPMHLGGEQHWWP